MNPLAPSSLSSRHFSTPLTQFGYSTSDDFPSFSSSYDDDSSKLLEESDDDTHPRSPVKPKKATKTEEGSKSKKAALLPLK